jgi:hypothetical protein
MTSKARLKLNVLRAIGSARGEQAGGAKLDFHRESVAYLKVISRHQNSRRSARGIELLPMPTAKVEGSVGTRWIDS